MAYSAADYIIERLIQQKVEALFGVPAVYCAALYAAAARVNPPAPAPAVFRTVGTSSDLEAWLRGRRVCTRSGTVGHRRCLWRWNPEPDQCRRRSLSRAQPDRYRQRR